MPFGADNAWDSACIDHSNNLGTTKQTVHRSERWEYYFRQQRQKAYVKPEYVTTKQQLADSMTKVLDSATFYVFRDYILTKSKTTSGENYYFAIVRA